MARARSIKPGFFKDADLLELPFEARLLFAGLWTLADRAGRLEDKPKQIKIEIFPVDTVDCNALLDLLAGAGLISRYAHDNKRYLQVITFTKHQNPHKNEPDSTLPAQFLLTSESEDISAGRVQELCDTLPKTEKHGASTVQARCKHGASTVPILLTPDSGLLTPDSPFLGGECAGTQAPEHGPPSASPHPPIFSDEDQDFCKTQRPDLDPAKTWANFADHYPPPKQTTANWRKWVRRENPPPVFACATGPPAVADPDSKAAVEAVGVAHGLGRWDELKQPWTAYKTRVRNSTQSTQQAAA
jgi:hypothetical protein